MSRDTNSTGWGTPPFNDKNYRGHLRQAHSVQDERFDFVVTVALGSILGSMLLSKDAALSVGLLALLSLIALQWAVARLSVRSPPCAG